jgi:hypothetical protein
VSGARIRVAASALAVSALGAGVLGGCAKVNSALSKQWITVQLAPDTSLAAARHVTAACSHVPGTRPERVTPTVAGGGVGSVRFDTTRATDADMARLQQCLQRFPVVQGLTVGEPGY